MCVARAHSQLASLILCLSIVIDVDVTILSHHFRNDAMMHFNSIAAALHAQRESSIYLMRFFSSSEYAMHTSPCPAFFSFLLSFWLVFVLIFRFCWIILDRCIHFLFDSLFRSFLFRALSLCSVKW